MATIVTLLALLVPDGGQNPRHDAFNVAKTYRSCLAFRTAASDLSSSSRKAGVQACYLLAIAYDSGEFFDENSRAIPQNYVLAADYYSVACNPGGLPRACIGVGRLNDLNLIKQQGGTSGAAAALSWYRFGCNMSNADKTDTSTSCYLAGAAVISLLSDKAGWSQSKSIADATSLLGRGCKLGNDKACSFLAEIEQTVAH